MTKTKDLCGFDSQDHICDFKLVGRMFDDKLKNEFERLLLEKRKGSG